MNLSRFYFPPKQPCEHLSHGFHVGVLPAGGVCSALGLPSVRPRVSRPAGGVSSALEREPRRFGLPHRSNHATPRPILGISKALRFAAGISTRKKAANEHISATTQFVMSEQRKVVGQPKASSQQQTRFKKAKQAHERTVSRPQDIVVSNVRGRGLEDDSHPERVEEVPAVCERAELETAVIGARPRRELMCAYTSAARRGSRRTR